MNKKLVSLLLCLLLVVSSCVIGVVTASAETYDATITLEGKQYGANIGDVVTFTVELTAPVNLRAVQGTTTYNSAVMEGPDYQELSDAGDAYYDCYPVITVRDNTVVGGTAAENFYTFNSYESREKYYYDFTEGDVLAVYDFTITAAGTADLAFVLEAASYPYVDEDGFTDQYDYVANNDPACFVTLTLTGAKEIVDEPTDAPTDAPTEPAKADGVYIVVNDTDYIPMEKDGDSYKAPVDFKDGDEVVIVEVKDGEEKADESSKKTVEGNLKGTLTYTPATENEPSKVVVKVDTVDPTEAETTAPTVAPTDDATPDEPTETPSEEATDETTIPEEEPTPDPENPADPETSDKNTSANTAAVQTGSSASAVMLLVVLTLALGAVLFARKKAMNK